MNSKNLYIHIPFCKNICPYCDFTKLIKNQKFEDLYIKQLKKDLSKLKDKSFIFETIYIGGGTPSSLNLTNLESILKITKYIKTKKCEFTIECNPEDINEELLILLKKYEVNRISIGIQTFKKTILKSIKRNYKINYYKLINLVKKYIQNINIDMIYGLPNYIFFDLKNDLRKVLKLKVKHLSFYSLIVDKGSLYYKENVKELNQDRSRKYYDYILKRLRKAGYKRYEVSNYAQSGYESKHNINYWKNNTYVGIGLGASGYESNIRYKNTLNFNEYINGINKKETEKITIRDKKTYFLITNLRLEDGFLLNEYKKIFKKDILIEKKDIINSLINQGFLEIKNDRLCCSDAGLVILDDILLKII